MKLPLIRLKIDYGGYTTCNPQRFGQRFVDRVANPGEILLFQKTKVKRREEKAAAEAAKRQKRADGTTDGDANNNDSEPDGGDGGEEENAAYQIQQLMDDFMKAGSKDSLRLLQADLNAAVFGEFVGKDNKNAIRNEVEASLKRTMALLTSEVAAEKLNAVGGGTRTADGRPNAAEDRKKKEEAIEALLREETVRREAVRAARLASGVLPANPTAASTAARPTK